MKQPSQSSGRERLITLNRLVKQRYHIEEKFEAGLVLKGWEVKAIRQHQIQIRDSYVHIKRGEAFLVGAHISPLQQACRQEVCEEGADRKLLLKGRQIDQLEASVQRKGYTIVVLDLHWKGPRAKATIALAKGKQVFDQRETKARQEWQRKQHRILKSHVQR